MAGRSRTQALALGRVGLPSPAEAVALDRQRLLAALIGVPPLRDVFDLEPIDAAYWPLLAAFPPLFLAIEEGRKTLARALAGRGSRAGQR